MNNYIFSQDPVLFHQSKPPYSEDELRVQMERVINNYNQYSQQPPPQPAVQVDVLGELDELLQNLNPSVSSILLQNEEYVELNESIQRCIQEELIKTIRWKINSNPTAIQKIEKIKSLVLSATKEYEIEQQKNMQELNDYIKNYSNITFDEYKRIKNNGNSSQ